MLESDSYIEKLKESSFSGCLLGWAQTMMPKEEIDVLWRKKRWLGAVMDYYLIDVAELYVQLKVANISKISFSESCIRIRGVGAYEFAPLSRTPFLALLYGMMMADEQDNSLHHNRLRKAGRLMAFMDDYFPRDAEILRNIVRYNSMTVPQDALTEDRIIEETEASLHPDLARMIQPQSVNDDIIVYVSYSWANSREMDAICAALDANAIAYKRDIRDCGYRENIKKFENEIGDGKIIIAIINDKYMRSIQCMYEMSMLVSNGHIADRLFPIVALDGKRDAEACVAYLAYWQEEYDKRKQLIQMLAPGTAQQAIDEMSYCDSIINEFNKFWNYISQYNTLSAEELLKDDCAKLIESLTEKIG